MPHIIGAGLSGLIAATQLPLATIFEANAREQINHKALLRFRSDVVSRLTGIPFRRVVVRKSIFSEGHHCSPSIALANQYSIKTNKMCLDRSIWKTEPVDRFIAPEDFIDQLIQQVGSRIEWEHKYDFPADGSFSSTPIISTIPMPYLLQLSGLPDAAPPFHNSPIRVTRYRIPDCDVFQTIYFPDATQSVYRASITGSLLIMESIGDIVPWEAEMVLRAFGIASMPVARIDAGHAQKFGKITPVDDDWRRKFIYDLTISRNIYSLGRFATWRNILLDDVADDIAVIKRLIAHGRYGATLQHTQRN